MPKNEYSLARLKDLPTLMQLPDGQEWTAPTLADLLALPADAVGNGKIGETPGGMEIAQINRAFKLIDAKDHEGRPIMITATITFRRNAQDEAEAERVAKAVEDTKTRSNASKDRQARDKADTIANTVQAYQQGAKDRAAEVAATVAKPVNIAETIKEALTVAKLVSEIAPKALTSGQ